jgi:hypothetical protein
MSHVSPEKSTQAVSQKLLLFIQHDRGCHPPGKMEKTRLGENQGDTVTYNTDLLVANIKELMQKCEEKQVINQREIDEDNETTDAMLRERNLLRGFYNALQQVLDRSEESVVEKF